MLGSVTYGKTRAHVFACTDLRATILGTLCSIYSAFRIKTTDFTVLNVGAGSKVDP